MYYLTYDLSTRDKIFGPIVSLVQRFNCTVINHNFISQKASAKHPRSGLKGSRLFSSVRKGFSKMRHKNLRTTSLPTGLRPPRQGASDDTSNTLAEVQEEDEMYPGEEGV